MLKLNKKFFVIVNITKFKQTPNSNLFQTAATYTREIKVPIKQNNTKCKY